MASILWVCRGHFLPSLTPLDHQNYHSTHRWQRNSISIKNWKLLVNSIVSRRGMLCLWGSRVPGFLGLNFCFCWNWGRTGEETWGIGSLKATSLRVGIWIVGCAWRPAIFWSVSAEGSARSAGSAMRASMTWQWWSAIFWRTVVLGPSHAAAAIAIRVSLISLSSLRKFRYVSLFLEFFLSFLWSPGKQRKGKGNEKRKFFVLLDAI